MKTLSLVVTCSALWAGSVWAQSDDPLPYDDDTKAEPAPRTGPRRDDMLAEDDAAEAERENATSLARLDDATTGVGGELLAGAMLLESSRGGGVDPRFGFGVRATWEFGRLLSDEVWRERFFVDLAWVFSSTSEGTQQVSAATTNHLVMVAPAMAFPLGGTTSPFAFFAQVGAGLNSSTSTVRIDSTSIPVNGGRFAFQYGVGVRGRPTIFHDGAARWAFRVEVTRFVRGYMQDTFIGAGVGALF